MEALHPHELQESPSLRAIFFWLARLQKLTGAIPALTARGWEIELDCFAIGSEVLVLDNGDLRKLAELGIGLALTLARGTERVDA